MTIKSYRKSIPALTAYTYLNTANSGMLTPRTMDFQIENNKALHEHGSRAVEDRYDQVNLIKKVVAKTFGTKAKRIALIPNFSFGMNTLSEALTQRDKYIVLKNDYPSLTLPIKSRHTDIDELFAEEFSISEFKKRYKKSDSLVLIISMIQYNTGLHLRESFLRKLKLEFPNILIIGDGTQYLGTTDYDFEQSAYDIVIASGYKWLMAGYGNGIMMFKKGVIADLDVRTIGYNTFKGLEYSSHPKYDIRYFEPGHQSIAAYGSLAVSLGELTTIGFAEIEKKIRKISDYARTQLFKINMLDQWNSLEAFAPSNIIKITGSQELFHFLVQHKVLCSYRGGIRISIHFYNNKKDINRLISTLQKYKER